VLHAELHGKLAADADDAERREDILTSTVFGTLLAANAWDILLEWFVRAESVRDRTKLAAVAADERRYWFWPYLDGGTEPDVLIRIGALLAIFEVKYNSGKSGEADAADPSGQSKDQLIREWHACSPQAIQPRYPDDLCRAIRACDRALVYLVRRAHWAKALAAAQQSAALDEEAKIYLLSWEHLDEVLAVRREIIWVELRMYLQRRGLTAFRGFRHAITPEHVLTSVLTTWGPPNASGVTGFGSSFPASALLTLQSLSLHGRNVEAGERASRPLMQAFDPEALAGIGALATRLQKGRHG